MHDFNDKATAPLWEYQGVACRGRSRRANDAFVFYTWGHLPALIFHDCGGTILVIGWFFAFWIVVQRWILVPPASNDVVIDP